MTVSERAIFVLGVTPRTGTHFLERMLRSHPDCAPLAPPGLNAEMEFEDYLLDNADLLDRYVERTRALWGPAWSGDDGLADTLAGGIGEGLLQSMESLLPAAARGKRLLVRTPSIGHLEVLPRLFPGARAVVVVRDPRAVADSAVRSFGRLHRSTRPPWEAWVEMWDREVRRLLSISASISTLTVQTVRHEDLMRRRAEMVPRLLQFLDLDPALYPADALEHQPVIGSSELVDRTGYVHFDVTTASQDVDLDSRGTGWPATQLRRLEHLAGDSMRAMGYEVGAEADGSGAARDLLGDAILRAEAGVKRVVRRVARP